ncbi:MAG: HTH domain-containing protein [Nitrosopumilus sp.]|nr:HTH domain-containing protein [Nitrosopumilus sp.]
MFEHFESRQHQVLALLQQHKGGLSIDDLVTQLEISRTAVNQHMVGLERDGLIKKAVQQKSTGGRPGWTYQITDEGINRLPKQYSWFSELLLDTLKEELGSQKLETYVKKVATSLVPQLRKELQGTDPKEHIQQVAELLQGLGYQTHTEPALSKKELPSLTAHNCVYHDLAIKHPEVCAFDIALLEQLVNRTVEHQECMAKGGHACRFAFKNS